MLGCFPWWQDCISLGSGEPSRSAYHSFVLYHNNSPRWGEIIKLPIPIDRFRGSHLRFEFRHCSSECPTRPSSFHCLQEAGTAWKAGNLSLKYSECTAQQPFAEFIKCRTKNTVNDQWRAKHFVDVCPCCSFVVFFCRMFSLQDKQFRFCCVWYVCVSFEACQSFT